MGFASENFPSRRLSDCSNLETQPAPRQLFKRPSNPPLKRTIASRVRPRKPLFSKSKRSSEFFRRPFFLYILPYLHSYPKIAWRIENRFDNTSADGEVAEAFVVEAVLRPVSDPAVDDF